MVDVDVAVAVVAVPGAAVVETAKEETGGVGAALSSHQLHQSR